MGRKKTQGQMPGGQRLTLTLSLFRYAHNSFSKYNLKKSLNTVTYPNYLSAIQRLLLCAAFCFARQKHILSFLSISVETRLHTY